MQVNYRRPDRIDALTVEEAIRMSQPPNIWDKDYWTAFYRIKKEIEAGRGTPALYAVLNRLRELSEAQSEQTARNFAALGL